MSSMQIIVGYFDRLGSSMGFFIGFVDLTQSFCLKTTEYAQSEQV